MQEIAQASTKQPRALYVLSFVELWERFSFYGMQAVLVLYLTKQFLLPDQNAETIFGTFLALGWGLTLAGGYLADHLLGFRRAIFIGGCFIIVGNFLLFLSKGLPGIYAGLALLICGTGLFKPNVSSLLGTLYGEDDPRRNSGFTLFYMGFNVGALAAAPLYGYVTAYFGWREGFILGSGGMLLGQLVLWWLRKTLGDKGRPPASAHMEQRSFIGCKNKYWVYLGIAAVVGIVIVLLQFTIIMSTLLLILGLALLVIQFYIAFKSDPVQRYKIFALMLLTLFAIAFYAIILQMGSSFTLFADRNIDRTLLGHTIPAATFSSLEPLFVVLSGGFFAWLWLYLSKKHREPSMPAKFALGILLAALSFGVIALGALQAMKFGTCSMLWLVGMYLFQGVGDVCLSPNGLSAVTTLAPPNRVGFFMGIWFIAIAIAGFLAGAVGKMTNVVMTSDVAASAINAAGVYYHAFMQMLVMSCIVAVAAFIAIPFIKSLIK